MPGLNHRIKSAVDNIFTNMTDGIGFLNRDLRITKQILTRTKMELDQRVAIDDWRRGMVGEYPDVLQPPTPRPYENLYDMVKIESTTARCIQARRQETFRNGWKLKHLWKYKCELCDKEYEHKPIEGTCDEELEDGNICGGSMLEPDQEQKRMVETFFKSVNANLETIIDVARQTEDDVNIADDMYVLIRQEYEVDEVGNILKRRIKEIVRGPPRYVRLAANQDGKIGGKWAVCLVHREEVFLWQNRPDGRCPICGRKLHDVKYLGLRRGSYKDIQSYWIEGEVIHRSRYRPSLTYGYAPINTLWDKCMILYNMHDYIQTLYHKKRLPSGLLLIKGRNQASIEAQWRKEQLELRKDPYHLPMIVVDPETGSGDSSFIRFNDNIKELEFIEVRNEIKKEIGAFYDVEPLFMNDTSISGGLNNEGLQIAVTVRAVEAGQNMHNEWINIVLDKMGVTDWKFELNPPEEKDEMAEKIRMGQDILNAQGMTSLGYDAELTAEGEISELFKFTKLERSMDVGTDLQVDAPSQDTMNRMDGDPNAAMKMQKEASRIEKEFWSQAAYAIASGKLWHDYANMNQIQKSITYRILEQAFTLADSQNFDARKVAEQIASKADIPYSNAERIVRTETTSVINKARELGYQRRDKNDSYRYRWAVTHDHRTSKDCNNIEMEVNIKGRGKGVPLEELKKIVRKHTKIGKNSQVRDWVPHINCRSMISRVV